MSTLRALLATYFMCAVRSAMVSKSSYKSFKESVDMPYPVSDTEAVVYNDRIYMMGGCISDQSCSLNTTTNALSCVCPKVTNKCIYFKPNERKWFNCASAAIPRYRHTTALVGSYIYIIGGRTIPDDSVIQLVERYDPVSNKWTSMFNWTDAISDGAAFSDSSQYLYHVGGYDSQYNSQNTLTIFDTFNKKWAMGAPMKYNRGDNRIATYKGEFYVMGGWSSTDDPTFCNPVKYIEKYNTGTRKWTTLAPLLYARGDVSTGSLGGYIFAIAGEMKQSGDPTCSRSVPVNSVTRFDPSYDAFGTWAVEEALSLNLFRFMSATYNSSHLSQSAIYLFGGQKTYNPVTKSFPLSNVTLRYVPYSVYIEYATGDSSNDNSLSDGAIAGIVIAIVVFLLFLIAGCFMLKKYRQSGFTGMAIKSSADRELVSSARFDTV